MICIDVVCPLYNSSQYIEKLYSAIITQKKVDIKNIVFPVTESNDNTYELLEKLECTIIKVKKEEFSHSLTREKCIIEYCSSPIVVMLTQDISILDDLLFYNLCKSINEEIVFTFAKQICNKKIIEKYIREKNYPEFSYCVGADDIDKMQLKAFFSSDACSAYSRDVFIKIQGYHGKNLGTNEDMYYCYNVLMNGYKFKYCADAIVEHYHDIPVKQLYKRYYGIGAFFKQNPIFLSYKSTSAAKLAVYVFFRCVKDFNLKGLLVFLPNMLSRYIGSKRGKRNG